jgi:hypothetical protein
MMTISFNIPKEDALKVGKIVTRAKKLHAEIGQGRFDAMSCYMDIAACIANGTPLKLDALLEADDFNFAHDVWGIQRHIDRDDASPTGGKLLNCFLPRFAA